VGCKQCAGILLQLGKQFLLCSVRLWCCFELLLLLPQAPHLTIQLVH
jgi:hypothetical protein